MSGPLRRKRRGHTGVLLDDWMDSLLHCRLWAWDDTKQKIVQKRQGPWLASRDSVRTCLKLWASSWKLWILLKSTRCMCLGWCLASVGTILLHASEAGLHSKDKLRNKLWKDHTGHSNSLDWIKGTQFYEISLPSCCKGVPPNTAQVFGHLLTSDNYDDDDIKALWIDSIYRNVWWWMAAACLLTFNAVLILFKIQLAREMSPADTADSCVWQTLFQVTGGRNGYGGQLANIVSGDGIRFKLSQLEDANQSLGISGVQQPHPASLRRCLWMVNALWNTQLDVVENYVHNWVESWLKSCVSLLRTFGSVWASPSLWFQDCVRFGGALLIWGRDLWVDQRSRKE